MIRHCTPFHPFPPSFPMITSAKRARTRGEKGCNRRSPTSPTSPTGRPPVHDPRLELCREENRHFWSTKRDRSPRHLRHRPPHPQGQPQDPALPVLRQRALARCGRRYPGPDYGHRVAHCIPENVPAHLRERYERGYVLREELEREANESATRPKAPKQKGRRREAGPRKKVHDPAP